MNMFELIGNILVSSIHNLFKNQPDVLITTKLTRMTEWNLGHHLANEIAKYIFWLNHDLDVTKSYYGNRRPDIIFHKRGINDLNFLVAEIKVNISAEEDIKRIKNWMDNPLCYRFGTTIFVQSVNNFEVTVFQRNGEKKAFSELEKAVSIPKISNSNRKPLINLADKISDIAKSKEYQGNSAKQARIHEYEKQIDQLVYKLYGLTPEEIKIVEND